MNFFLQLVIITFCSFTTFAQDYSDAKLMKSMSYMAHVSSVSCDSMDGNNLEQRICLNIEFQKVDSVLNVTFLEYFNRIQSDSIAQSIKSFQNDWVLNRRVESRLKSDGYTGHTMGIVYLTNMVFITRKRTEVLVYLLENK